MSDYIVVCTESNNLLGEFPSNDEAQAFVDELHALGGPRTLEIIHMPTELDRYDTERPEAA